MLFSVGQKCVNMLCTYLYLFILDLPFYMYTREGRYTNGSRKARANTHKITSPRPVCLKKKKSHLHVCLSPHFLIRVTLVCYFHTRTLPYIRPAGDRNGRLVIATLPFIICYVAARSAT